MSMIEKQPQCPARVASRICICSWQYVFVSAIFLSHSAFAVTASASLCGFQAQNFWKENELMFIQLKPHWMLFSFLLRGWIL